MTPVKEIIPGFEIETVTFAKNQPEYIPLPAWVGEDGLVVTRWRLTWAERFRLFLTGNLWLSILTFKNPLQPVKLDTTCPLQASFMLDKETWENRKGEKK